MCKKTFFLISLLLVLGLVGSTMATTWYVDNAVASSGNGQSWATAFKNFSDIVWGSVAAGDFIYISGGSSGGTKTYTESWSVGASGTSGNPITIAIDAANSSHNGTAVFDYNALGDYATVDGIFLSGRSYITISGNVNGQNHIAFKNLRNITNRTAATCIVGWGNTAITIDHIDVTNCNNGVRLWSGTAGTGYEVMYSNFTQIRGDVAVMVSVSESTWDQVKIHDNYIEILYNSAVPPGESGNYGGADGFQTCSGTSIYRNTCKVTNTSSVYTSTQHPDMIQAQGNYLKVYDNDFIDLGDSAFDYDCYSNPTPHDVRIYNNLYRLVNSLDPYPEFFRLYISNSNALTSINNFKLLNNTYVDASGYYTIRFNGFKTNNPTGSGNEIKNNIFYNCNGGAQYEMIRIDGSTGFTDASFSFDGNIYYNSSQSNYIYYNGTAYTAADWIAAREPNGHTSAPTFVSYSSKNINNNLHLASTDNVAKDTGVSLGSYFTTDKDGITRPQGSAWDIGAYEYVSGANDTTAPSPDPMTWSTDPYATGDTSISMTATTATDSSGVEYYFDCTAGGGNDSGWQDSTTYEDTGLSASTQYTYRVKARDKSSNQNETAYSTTKSATTNAADTTAPSPDPMTWSTDPYATGDTSISMTATTATDSSGVEYYFDCTTTGGTDSGWQDSTTYEDTGLDANTSYTYRVKARDKSSNQNETAYSTTKSATTEAGGGEPNDITGDVADTRVQSNGVVGWTGNENERVGGAGTEGWDSCVVYVFQLPTVGAGEEITAANLSFYLDGYSYYSPEGNADLYGIAYRSGSTVQVSDWYQGAYNGDPNATALQDNIMTPSSPESTTINTSISGDNALKAYLNAQYSAGAEGGDYVFIRVNADSNETNSPQRYWDVSTADNATASQRPVLTVTIESAGDTTPPSPDPMTWSTEPYATGTTSISMTATTATDASGVEYYFDCTAGGGNDSGWQDSTTYEDTGLSASTQYTYQVKTRDKSSNQNETGYSTTKSATTDAPPDTTAPSPDPMTWATVPYATGASSISMTATTATDASGVEYYFDCTAGGGNDSGWQDSTSYTDTGLSELTEYTYRVKARDKSSNQNETAYSTTKSATTQDGTAPSPDPMTWSTEPYATGASSISMTATTATDSSGVEYYFDCTAGGGNDSGWQDSATYEDTGLSELTEYTYRVQARDKSSNQNATGYSTTKSATTEDGTSPSPDPMTWSTEPYSTGTTSISMTATNATDASGVEYYFDCTAGGGSDSGWQDSTTYEDTGLSASTQYTYQVQSRDKSSNQNTTGWSTTASATTDAEAEPDLVSWWKLDESSGTTADDSSGNNHDGTRSGGSWAPTGGIFEGAVELGDATSDHVEVPTTGMSASAGTVALWGRIEGTQTSSRYFFGHTSAPGTWSDRIQLQMDEGDNKLDLGLGDEHNRDVDIVTLSADTWYHIALTWDSGDYVVYVDGIEEASGTYTGLSTLNSIADIGNTGNSNERIEAFQGLLDDVRIYDQALSKYDIADLAGITIASSPSPADNATDVSTTADLSWSAGYYAADVNGHDVYMGSDYNSVADANHSSAEFKGNQSSTTYDPGTMSASTTYYWAIDEINDTNVWPGDVWSFTTASSDTTAPSPDPMTWATEPYATGATSISMTATTATDVSGVEYFFDCTTEGGHDSSWQDSTTYVDTGLTSETQYSYKVQARDKSSNHNETGYSTTKSATTDFDPNLVSLWRLDESSGTTAADSSGNGHNGTLSGGSWAPTSGKYDGAVELGDANSDHVQVPTTGMSASAGTVALWGRIEGTQTSSRYFFGHTSAPGTWSDRIQLQMDEGDNKLDLGLGDEHNRDVDIVTLSADTWYHIALTWDSGDYVVYVDGIEEASGTYTGLSTLNSIADIGNTGNSNERIEAFQGLLDEVRIYDRVLSADDVNDLANP